MSLSVADIDRWDPEAVREVFHAATERADVTLATSRDLGALDVFETWGGDAAVAAQHAIALTRQDLDAHGNEAIVVANAARIAADDIKRIKGDLQKLRTDAAALDMSVDAATGSIVAGPGFVGNPMELLLKQIQLQPRLDAILADAEASDDELARAIDMADGDLAVTGPHDNRPWIQTALTQPMPTDPEQFEALWQQLTQEQRDWLFSQNPELGNHPGMPFVDRDHFNQLNLDTVIATSQASVDQMQARFDELAAKTYTGTVTSSESAELAHLLPRLVDARYDLQGLQTVQATLDLDDGVPRYLGFLDSEGHAAVAINNPDLASHNAVLVPGTGQDLNTFAGSDGKSSAMYHAALDADSTLAPEDVSLTTWMGYDRPMDLTEAAWPGRAESGGVLLNDYLAGMAASHDGEPAVTTVIGHSYGSTVVGGAATDGNTLLADNVIAVGSPGMLVDEASDLSVGTGAQVFSMTARNDVISVATDMTLGADPYSSEFGVTRLWTDPGPSLDSTGLLPTVAAHSSYWSQDNPGLANMGSIIAGQGPVRGVTPDGQWFGDS